MSKEQESLKTEIYGLLKSRGYNPISKDSAGNTVPVPEEAEVFEFIFSKDNKDFGKVWVTLDGLKQLIIYYGKEVADSPKNGSQDSNSFSQLTNVLKRFATNRQLSFERSDQSNLEADMAKREHTKKQEQINEGYYPIGKNASGNNNIPSVTMRIQHTRPIEEGEQRYRNISKIFVENQDGERILLPTNKPGLARTYVRHIAEGGKPNDERWNHLSSLCEEYQKMAGFVRATCNGQFNESAQSLVNEGTNHYQKLRETLSKLSGKRGYNEYFESYAPALMEDEEQVDLSEMFMSASLDPRIESVMPILSKLSRNITETKKDMEEVIALENWADEIITHKGGRVTYKDGVTKHQSGPDQYGGSSPDEEELDRVKTSHINKMDKALGVKFDREKKMGGGIKVDEGPNDNSDDYVDPEEANYDSPEWQETERNAKSFMDNTKKREVAQAMHAILSKGKEQGMAESSGDPEITPGMKTQHGTVVKVKGNTVTIKASNGELTNMNIHDIQQGMTEGEGDFETALSKLGGNWSSWHKIDSHDPNVDVYNFDDGEGGYYADGVIEHDLQTGKVTVDYKGDEYHGPDVEGTFDSFGDAMRALRGGGGNHGGKAPNFDKLGHRELYTSNDLRKTDRTGRKGTLAGGPTNRLKQSIQNNKGNLGPKGVLPEQGMTEEEINDPLDPNRMDNRNRPIKRNIQARLGHDERGDARVRAGQERSTHARNKPKLPEGTDLILARIKKLSGL